MFRPSSLLLLLLLLVVCIFAGCTTSPETASVPTAPAADGAVVAEFTEESGVSADVLCNLGGGHAVDRTSALIQNVSELLVTWEITGSYTGLQLGWAVDGAEPEWLPPVSAAGTQTIPVQAAQHEISEPRWEFLVQGNLERAPQDCYTGAGRGEFTVRIALV